MGLTALKGVTEPPTAISTFRENIQPLPGIQSDRQASFVKKKKKTVMELLMVLYKSELM